VATVSISPDVLQWAQARSGIKPSDLRKAFPKLLLWEQQKECERRSRTADFWRVVEGLSTPSSSAAKPRPVRLRVGISFAPGKKKPRRVAPRPGRVRVRR